MSSESTVPAPESKVSAGVATPAKVAPRQGRYASGYWLVGGLLAVALAWGMSHTPKTTTAAATPVVRDPNSYRDALDANLAQLSAMRDHAPPLVVREVQGGSPQPLGSLSPSKDLVARQHAPTSMYRQPALGEHTGPDDKATVAVMADTIAHPEMTIVAGEMIHAVLESAIHSDLPGMVRASVSQPVYSYTGGHCLVPAGSRLIGEYQSDIVLGQRRVMVLWHRVVLPDGTSLTLDSPGSDSLGRAGLSADRVNSHFLARFGESALLSILAVGAATGGVGSQDQYNSGTQYRASLAQSFQQRASQSLQATQSNQPTLMVNQGASINVFVAKDLSFYGVLTVRDKPNELPFVE